MIRHFAVAMNVIIALAYLGIGLYVAPKFSIAAGKLGAQVARAAGLVFFVTCAGTHFELAFHAAQLPSQVGPWFHSWHGLVIHTLQGIAGWAFTVLAVRYLSVRIMNREHYETILDDRIQQLKNQLASEHGDQRRDLGRAQARQRSAMDREQSQERVALTRNVRHQEGTKQEQIDERAVLGQEQTDERATLGSDQSEERNTMRRDQTKEDEALKRQERVKKQEEKQQEERSGE